MKTMASKAASLMAHGRGVLVLDEYALAVVTGPPWPGLGFDRYTELVLQSTDLRPYLSAVIVSRDTVLDRPPHRHGIGLGVRVALPAGRAPGDLRSGLADLASRNVTLAEWRVNLPAGRTRRGLCRGVVSTVAPSLTECAAESLAECAGASLAAGITPILTVAMPVLETQSQGVTHAATAKALAALSAALVSADVDPAAVLLRVNMIVAGSANRAQPQPLQVAESTLAVLHESIDPDLGGVIFLSSGQSLERACENLLAIADLAHKLSSPWPITFGFTRSVVGASLGVSPVKKEQVVRGLGYVEVKNEELVHDALIRACGQAFQSASPRQTSPNTKMGTTHGRTQDHPDRRTDRPQPHPRDQQRSARRTLDTPLDRDGTALTE